MTETPAVLELHAVRHPKQAVRQVGFPLDHPFLERCWAPLIGPSSVMLLRRCSWLWQEASPVRVPTEELSRQLGLGRGAGASSPIWHTIRRVVEFGFASQAEPSELAVYTEVPPVPARSLTRLPLRCRAEHARLLGAHLDALARAAGQAPSPPVAHPDVLARAAGQAPSPIEALPPHLRMAARLERLGQTPSPSSPPPSR